VPRGEKGARTPPPPPSTRDPGLPQKKGRGQSDYNNPNDFVLHTKPFFWDITTVLNGGHGSDRSRRCTKIPYSLRDSSETGSATRVIPSPLLSPVFASGSATTTTML
jgi:hypothetical protein